MWLHKHGNFFVRIAEKRINKLLRECQAEKFVILERIGVNNEHLVAKHKLIQVVEITDDDTGA